VTRESVAISSRRPSGSTRSPDYMDVVSASDWVKAHFPAAAANLRDALRPGQDRHRDPSPTWKPNHDPDPEVTAMTLTINETAMISDQTAHTADAGRDLHQGHRLWPHIQGRAAELGLTGHDAVARVSQPPSDIGSQQKQDGERPDPDVAR
jgi:hypothetical protein